MRVWLAHGWFSYCLFDPLAENLSVLHNLESVQGEFQMYR